MSIQPDREITHVEEQAYNYFASELSDTLAYTRQKAAELGMFGAKVVFAIPKSGEQEQRIVGMPFAFKVRRFDEPLLLVIVNHIIYKSEKNEHLVAFSDEMVVSGSAISTDSSLVAITREGLQQPDPQGQPPVIWKTTSGGWEIFRGPQNYYVPQLPQGTDRLERLKMHNFQSEQLATLLSSIRPGYEVCRSEI